MPKRKKRLTKAGKRKKFKTIRAWLESKRKKKNEGLNKELEVA